MCAKDGSLDECCVEFMQTICQKYNSVAKTTNLKIVKLVMQKNTGESLCSIADTLGGGCLLDLLALLAMILLHRIPRA
jgi:hypothetical protein